jgi:hypothetical protein
MGLSTHIYLCQEKCVVYRPMDAVWLHLVVSQCRRTYKYLADLGVLPEVDVGTRRSFIQTGHAALTLGPGGHHFRRLGHGTQSRAIGRLRDSILGLPANMS